MEGFYRAEVVHRRRNLRGGGRKLRRQPAAQALHLEKVSAVVRVDRIGLDPDAGDKVRGIDRANDRADALSALGDRQFQTAGGSQPASRRRDSRFVRH